MRGFVAEISDGQTITEEEMSWPELKIYLERYDLRIIELCLHYDEKVITLHNEARVYFYSKKIQVLLGGQGGSRQYSGIGASDQDPNEVTIYWFDGQSITIEKRKVQDSPAFIYNVSIYL